jgi:hypothetical protein
MVGAEGFEPPTLCSQSRCATRLRYAPTLLLIVSRLDSLPAGWRLMLDQPRQQPYNEHDWNDEDGAERRGKKKQKSPITPSVASRLAKVAAHQQVISSIRLPCNVEDIAEQGNRTHKDPNPNIGGHSNQRHIGKTTHPGSQRDDERQQPRKNVPQTGNQADDSIKPKPYVCPGYAKSFVQQNLEPLQRLVSKNPRAFRPAFGIQYHWSRAQG